MRPRHHISPWQVLADLITCVAGIFLLIVSVLLVVPHLATPPKQEGIKPKAEYLVTLTWDDNRDVDLDLWLQDPNGKIVFYGVREAVNISLDRDSRGFDTNRTRRDDGNIVYSANREVIAIRAIIPGDYLVAVSYYDGKYVSEERHFHFQGGEPEAAIDALVQVDKVNPIVTQVVGEKVHLTRIKEAKNVVAFHVDIDGAVTVLPLPPENLIETHEKVGRP